MPWTRIFPHGRLADVAMPRLDPTLREIEKDFKGITASHPLISGRDPVIYFQEFLG